MAAPINRSTKSHRLLDGVASFAGPLSAANKACLRACIEAPSSATWEQAYSLVLTPQGLSLWQAVCVVDPTFPAMGDDARGQRRPWPRGPDQLTLVRAIRGAVDGRITRAQAAAAWSRQGPERAAAGPGTCAYSSGTAP